MTEPVTTTAPSRIVVTPPGFGTELWRAATSAARVVQLSELCPGARRMTILGAHPDDESIGAGRLAHAWSVQRGPVELVSMTAGEACFDHVGLTMPDLADRRRAEFEAAGTQLGAQGSSCWNLPDGQVSSALADVRDRLTGVIESTDVVLAPWIFDPHPDHAALGRTASEICAQTGTAVEFYPIWMSYWCEPSILDTTGTPLVTVTVDPPSDLARERALACHTSQLQPPTPAHGPVVTPEMLEHHGQQWLLRPSGEPTW